MTHAHNTWVPDTNDFGARLALIRHHERWNAKEAAMACGVKPQSWREWELFGRKPHDYEGICKQIAERTKCDLIWLMTGDPSHGTPTRPGTPLQLPRLDSNQQPFGCMLARRRRARLRQVGTVTDADVGRRSA